ncbi:MAG: tRNA pseudouridine(13) synthase TruD [Candidatus Pacearchaeota archaeon]
MKQIEKILAKIKFKPDDFIVEEIGEGWECSVSESPNFDSNPDLSKLDSSIFKDFLWCELEKVDLDHFQAIKELGARINKFSNDIGYAGVKDKKAHTSQRISIFKPNLDLIKQFRHPKIILKNFRWEKRKLKMGFLEGNKFKIVLRDVDKKNAIKISSKIKNLSFFPNYFGTQRFGSQRGNNVEIGILIIKRKFEEAVWNILTYISETEREEFRTARKKLKSEKNFKDALNYFSSFLKIERELLFYLSKNPGDYLGALKKADRKNVLMFINSVQSKIFNEILEKAINEGLDFTKEGQKNCLLVGYKTHFSSGRLGEIEMEILKKNGIETEDFNIKEIPYLRTKGAYRKAIIEIKNAKVSVFDDEEFHGSKKILFEFFLPSGVYATTFLENFFEFG